MVLNEFSLIDTYFTLLPNPRTDVLLGIGDDGACLRVPLAMDLVVSTDTLVSEVHFLPNWDAYDIALRALLVNISDMAAMAATPCWVTLALTLPVIEPAWLERFSQGLKEGLLRYQMALVGGDTTRGALAMTITIHGLVPQGKALRRSTANAGDKIYVTGALGAAALAVACLAENQWPPEEAQGVLMQALLQPRPRTDWLVLLQTYASAAIDISDGLSSDLAHICRASGLGAWLSLETIPIHPLVSQWRPKQALDFALNGGDDYELCFTVPASIEKAFLVAASQAGLKSHCIGTLVQGEDVRAADAQGRVVSVPAKGYCHF